MSLNFHLRYWLIPSLVLLPLLFFYFVGLEWATNIVAPKGSWEVGPIENIQLILLLGIFVLAAFWRIRTGYG